MTPLPTGLAPARAWLDESNQRLNIRRRHPGHPTDVPTVATAVTFYRRYIHGVF